MKRLFFFLLLCPFGLLAQPDTLKPIDSDLLPTTYWNGHYLQTVGRLQYTYDGLDVRRAKDLGQYILASGDPDAIREFNAYIGSRHAGGWLIAGGVLSMVIGTPIMLSNPPDKDGRFYTSQPFRCPTGQYCGTPAGGGSFAPVQVPDNQRKRSFNTGSSFLLGGAILAGIGWGLLIPGRHLRRSVQYYNRALKQRGISWQLTPYSSLSNSGVGLVGRF